MSTATRRALCAAFLLAICMPMALVVTGAVQPKAIENRPLAGLPDLAPRALLHKSTYDELNGYLTDRVPGRDRAVAARERLTVDLFGESAGSQVVVGTDGWLYLAEVVRRGCYAPAEVDAVTAQLAELQRLVAATGRKLRVLVPPQKETVYPQHLQGRDRRSSCIEGNTAALQAAMAGATPGYPRALLDAARTRPDLYYPNDTHWNGEGALLATQVLVDSLAPGTFDAAAYDHQRGAEAHEGDLTRLQGLPATVTADVVTPTRVQAVTSTDLAADRGVAAVREQRQGPGLVGGRTLVVHDSFGRLLQPLASPWLADVEWLDIGGGIDPGALSRAMADADTVVVELTERNLPVLFPDVVAAARTLPPRAAS